MKTYRVIAEVSFFMEAVIEAENLEEAQIVADNLDEGEFLVWDDTGLSNGFDIVKIEEVTE